MSIYIYIYIYIYIKLKSVFKAYIKKMGKTRVVEILYKK